MKWMLDAYESDVLSISIIIDLFQFVQNLITFFMIFFVWIFFLMKGLDQTIDFEWLLTEQNGH